MQSPLVALLVIAAGLIVVPYAGGTRTVSDSARNSDTVIIAIPSTPNSIDADRTSSPEAWMVVGQFIATGQAYKRIAYPYSAHSEIPGLNKIQGMTFPDTNLAHLQPNALSSCKTSADGKNVTFNIRPHVISPYGNELTSSDIIWAVKRSIALKAIGNYFLSVANAASIKQWQAPNKYTVKVTSPTAPMALLCNLTVHSWNSYSMFIDAVEAQKHASKSDPWANAWLTTHDASFGPYHITSWETGRQIVMDPNPNYWGGPPKIKKIIFTVVPDASDRVSLLESGKIDIATELGPDSLAAIGGKAGVAPASQRSVDFAYLIMNNKKPPFDNVKVRQAMNYAVPSNDIVNRVYSGLATPLYGVTSTLIGGIQNFQRYTYNVAKAKQLLAEAGYKNGFSVPLTYSSADPTFEQMAILLQTAYAKIGVKVTLTKVPPAAANQIVSGGNAQFALWVDGSFLPDPIFATSLWYKTGGCCDYENYSNPAVDKLLDKCNGVISFTAREKCSVAPQNLISKDAPVVWLAEPDFGVGINSSISGYGLQDPGSYFWVYRMSKS